MMKVIAFNGSPRQEGNTAKLIGYVFEELQKEGIQTELIHLGIEPLYGCRACYECGVKKNTQCVITRDAINSYIQKCIEAEGIILGSPTYFTDVTASMKAFIDRVGFVARMNGDLFRRKVGAAVVSVRRAGAMHTFDSLNHFFLINQMLIAGSSYWNIGIGGRQKDAVQTDEEGIQTMRVLGQNMAWLLKKISS